MTRFDPFVLLCREHGLPEPQREKTFHPTRKWQADYLWRAEGVIVERDGGIWRRGGGAHSRPTNILRDMEKGNAAQLMGYKFFRFTPKQLENGWAIGVLKSEARFARALIGAREP